MTKSGLAKDQAHYQHAEDLQPIEIMQRNSTPEEFKGFLKNNAIKYLLRAKHKGSELKDYEKAFQYCAWLVQAESGEIINPREGAK